MSDQLLRKDREKLTAEERKLLDEAFQGLMSCDQWDYSERIQEYWDKTVKPLREKVLRQFDP